MFWKDVTTGGAGQERRLVFDKAADRLDAASLDRMAQLSVERGRLGSFVPPMRSAESRSPEYDADIDARRKSLWPKVSRSRLGEMQNS